MILSMPLCLCMWAPFGTGTCTGVDRMDCIRSFSVSLSDAVCVFLHVWWYLVPFGTAGGVFSQHIHCKSVTLFELVRLFRMCVLVVVTVLAQLVTLIFAPAISNCTWVGCAEPSGVSAAILPLQFGISHGRALRAQRSVWCNFYLCLVYALCTHFLPRDITLCLGR